MKTDRLNFLWYQKRLYRNAFDSTLNFFLTSKYYPFLVTIILNFWKRSGKSDDAEYNCIEEAMSDIMILDKLISYRYKG